MKSTQRHAAPGRPGACFDRAPRGRRFAQRSAEMWTNFGKKLSTGMRARDLEELGLHRPRTGGGHGDASVAELLVERLRERDRPGLRRRIARRVRHRLKARRGGEREDRAAASLSHRRREPPGQIDHRLAEDSSCATSRSTSCSMNSPAVPKPALLTSTSTSRPSSAIRAGSADRASGSARSQASGDGSDPWFARARRRALAADPRGERRAGRCGRARELRGDRGADARARAGDQAAVSAVGAGIPLMRRAGYLPAG